MFKRHTVIRKVYEMQGGGYPFTHIYIYIYIYILISLFIHHVLASASGVGKANVTNCSAGITVRGPKPKTAASAKVLGCDC